jgi:hypothetical protein
MTFTMEDPIEMETVEHRAQWASIDGALSFLVMILSVILLAIAPALVIYAWSELL